MLLGCGPTASRPQAEGPQRQLPDPWPSFAQNLRRENDSISVRRLLGQLGADLASNSAADQPKGPTPAQDAAIAQALTLPAEDAAEVRSAAFTPLDAIYLAECCYLRDIARSLELANLAPQVQADAVFEWVCRQVELRPWVLDTGNGLVSPAVPTSFVLRRGAGSGYERATIALGIWHQLGLDAVLVGGPNAQTLASVVPFDARSGGGVPRGPFWGVGVRIGSEVRVYDCWRGEVLPGTLQQIRAEPQRLEPWRQSGWDVPEADVRNASIYLATPLSGLAPRLALLEDKLQSEAPVRLTYDFVGMQKRLESEAKIPGVPLWNPPDRFGLLRVAATFLPADDGGRDTGRSGTRLYDQYRISLFPRVLFSLPVELPSGEARDRLIAAVAESYDRAFFQSPSPRERIQRGAIFEAVPQLVTRRSEFSTMAERLRTDRRRETELREWITGSTAVYDALGRAKLDERTNPEGVNQARGMVEEFWRVQRQGAQVLIDATLSGPGLAEATYLIALAKQELAIRSTRRVTALEADGTLAKTRTASQERGREQTREKAVDAWNDAVEWWSRYEPLATFQETGAPGRTAHAARMMAQARAASSNRGRP
jgi:hypothetical protein